MNRELIKAAQALIDRWDSPLWKEVEHTGAYIARLRRAVEQAEPVESVPQDLEEFIAAHDYDKEDMCSGCVPSYALRAWMAGHVRVPVEPTPSMIRAGQIASRYWSASDSKENGLAPIYRAMLTASKEPHNE